MASVANKNLQGPQWTWQSLLQLRKPPAETKSKQGAASKDRVKELHVKPFYLLCFYSVSISKIF